jgi:hypothetical protein
MTDDHMKDRAQAIVNEIRQIPITADGSHRNKRRLMKERLLKTVPHCDRWLVETYVRQLMHKVAREQHSERAWYQSNTMLFMGGKGND